MFSSTIPRTTDKPRTWRYWVEIALMVVSTVGVLAAAVYVTADAAAGNPSPGQVVAVAWLGAMAGLAVLSGIRGVLGCLDGIRRAGR